MKVPVPLSFLLCERNEMEKGIRRMFSAVSGTYELVNHLLTFGLDITWRKKTVSFAASGDGRNWMDICSGTGETAFYLNKRAAGETRVFAVDFCLPMLERATYKFHAGDILFTIADASKLPFAGGSFDLITISFATRNINVNREALVGCFREFHRVLTPGGRFFNLETSQPSSSLLRSIFHSYVKLCVRPVGRAISGSDSAYAYLSSTIPRFYPADQLSDLLREAGFGHVDYRHLIGGIAAIHEARK